jgi:hypothetical protein
MASLFPDEALDVEIALELLQAENGVHRRNGRCMGTAGAPGNGHPVGPVGMEERGVE